VQLKAVDTPLSVLSRLCRMQLAESLVKQKKYVEAMQILQDEISKEEKANIADWLYFHELGTISRIASVTKQFAKAEMYAKKFAHNCPWQIFVDANQEMSNVYVDENQLSKAIEVSEQGIKTINALPGREADKSFLEFALADLYRKVHKLSEARSHLDKSLSFALAVNNDLRQRSNRLANVYWRLATLAVEEYKTSEAMDKFNKSAECFEQVDSRFKDRAYVSMLEDWLKFSVSEHDKAMADKVQKLLTCALEKFRQSQRDFGN
jgi:hypothetical protein